MLFTDPTETIRWIRVPGSRGRPQCDRCGYLATDQEVAAMPVDVFSFIGTRPLDIEVRFTADCFGYGICPCCGKGHLQLVLVPQDLFGCLVPPDIA